jgi:hypothetical protein
VSKQMVRWALSLFALVASLAPVPGCLASSSSSSDAGAEAAAPAPTDDGGSPGVDAPASGNDATGPVAEAAAGTVPITPDPGGYVAPSSNSVGIQGAWYGYGDGWGTSGAPPGDCEVKGMHMVSQCSSITSPQPAMATDGGDGGATATFPPTAAGAMCLSGTAAKVIGTPPDYSNMFGIGIGLDFNNQNGVKGIWDASMNHVVGFTFHISGVPTGGVLVEFPTTDTDAMGSDSWSITAMSDGDYTADLNTMASDRHHLSQAFQMTGMQPAFKPSQMKSIQFHVATNIRAAISVSNLCVSNLAAVTM